MNEFPVRIGKTPLVAFAELGSTNAEALARASQGVLGPLWIVAELQTAGRGRRGRAWVSEPGNLYASLLLTDIAPAAATPEICFVAALALHDAVLDCCAGLAPARLTLKWPNDLLLDGGKLAGILVEGSMAANGIVSVVGFGMNCRTHPQDTALKAIDLGAAGLAVEPAALLAALDGTMTRRLTEWDRGRNFGSIRAAWLMRATGLGGAIEVKLSDRTIGGTFEAIDASGCLVLLRSDGVRETIRAGDVFPLASGV
jgi:BirA family biotin operon repressor/biotin-[acetyl-CoA-carboxylase] ligase